MARADPSDRTQPPDPVLAGNDTDFGQFIGPEPTCLARVISVDQPERVDDGPSSHFLPLGRETLDLARHRDRHPDLGTSRGQLTDEREGYFPGRYACDKYAAAWPRTFGLGSAQACAAGHPHSARSLNTAETYAQNPALTRPRVASKGLPVIGAGITYGAHTRDGGDEP